MRSLFETALQYLHGVPDDFYGVDVAELRTTMTDALSDSTVFHGWKMTLDGEQPTALEGDYEYADDHD